MRANYSRKLRFRVAHKCAWALWRILSPLLEKIKTVQMDGLNFLVGAKDWHGINACAAFVSTQTSQGSFSLTHSRT